MENLMHQTIDFVNDILLLDKRKLLTSTVAIQGIFVFAFVICSFVVSDTVNAGFNCVLTGLLNIGIAIGTFFVIRKSKAPIAIGFIIGSSIMLLVLNLMTTIYWGQLSRCIPIVDNIAQYSCTNRTAYGAVSAFSALLFIFQSMITAALVYCHGSLVQEDI